MIALPGGKVVNLDVTQSVTGLAIGRFELVQLRISLAGEPAFRSLAIKIGTRAVVQSSVQVDPHLGFGIASVYRSLRSLSQAESDKELVER